MYRAGLHQDEAIRRRRIFKFEDIIEKTKTYIATLYCLDVLVYQERQQNAACGGDDRVSAGGPAPHSAIWVLQLFRILNTQLGTKRGKASKIPEVSYGKPCRDVDFVSLVLCTLSDGAEAWRRGCSWP